MTRVVLAVCALLCLTPVCLRAQDYEDEQVDIVFVVDDSSNINAGDFALITNFMVNAIDSWTIAADAVNVAIILSGDFAIPILGLSEFAADKAGLLEYVEGITPSGFSGRDLSTALDIVRDILLPENGDRSAAKDVVIFITTGVSQDPAATQTALNNLLAEKPNIKIIGIGIGVFDDTELRNIASDPHEDCLFSGLNFSDLSDLGSEIAELATEDEETDGDSEDGDAGPAEEEMTDGVVEEEEEEEDDK